MFNILDCTLRDGNHAINYQFDAATTRNITKGLINAGIKYIEIGHPSGPGTQRSKNIKLAAATDVEYLESVTDLADKANIGTFFLPSVGEMSDIDLDKEYGMKFIRIGSNVGEVEAAEPFVKYAKKVGLEVHFSLMKAYAMGPYELLNEAKTVESFGADVIHLMDSAGALLPDDVRKCISVLKGSIKSKIGFHAHDNLRLAMANALAALKEGSDFVDASLRGLGRSAGNCQIDALVPVLKRSGYEVAVEMDLLMNAGQELVVPLMKKKAGLDSFDIIFGYAGFHSNFLPMFERIAAELQVDLFKLIVQVCTKEKVNPTEELIREIANTL